MKTLLLVLLALTCVPAQAGYETGAADQVLVMPHSGGRAHYGQVDLSQSAAVKNQLPLANGGTGQSSALSAFQSLYKSIATTLGDLVYGGTSGTPTRLPIGSTNQVLAVVGGVPAWQALSAVFTTPSVTRLTSTGTTAGYLFTVTSANATVGATYTNNGNTYTILGTIAGDTHLFVSGASAPTATGTLTKATGTGDSTITFSANQALATYTPPAGTLYLRITGVSAGGGGAPGISTSTNGGPGTITAFGPGLILATGGAGASGGNNNGGSGGTVIITGTAVDEGSIAGGSGGGAGINGVSSSNSQANAGAMGAASCLGGAGGGGTANTSGQSATANSGSGGGGGGAVAVVGSNTPGAGGGAGACIRASIPSPSGTYYYAIGVKGSKGTGGTNGGDAGDGQLTILAYYQ